MRGPHVQALDLGYRVAVQRPQRDAGERVMGRSREQQPAARRRVRTGKLLQLLGESLEAEIDLEPLRVFDKERAGTLDVIGRRRLPDIPCGRHGGNVA
jgi:hypothetical protein